MCVCVCVREREGERERRREIYIASTWLLSPHHPGPQGVGDRLPLPGELGRPHYPTRRGPPGAHSAGEVGARYLLLASG